MEERERREMRWMWNALAVALCCVCAISASAGAPQKAYAEGYYATVNGQPLSGEIDINDLLTYGITYSYDTSESYWMGTKIYLYEDGSRLPREDIKGFSENGVVHYTSYFPFTAGHEYTLKIEGLDGTTSSSPVVWEQYFSFTAGGSSLVEEPDEGEDPGGGAPEPEDSEGSGLDDDGLDEGSGGTLDVDDGPSESELQEGDDETSLPDGSGDPEEASPEVLATDLRETEEAVQPESTTSQQNVNAEERPTSEADATWEAESRPEGFDGATQLASAGDTRSGMTGSELLSKGAVYGLAAIKGLSDNSDANTAEAIDLTIVGIPYATLVLFAILFASLPFGFVKRYGSFKLALTRASRLA